MLIEKVYTNRKRCPSCSKKADAASKKAHNIFYKAEIKARKAEDHLANKEQRNLKAKADYRANIERYHAYDAARKEVQCVRNHHRVIFNPESKQHRNYKGMPFFDDWNPARGGSFKAGADWIVTKLGLRPEGSSLHIMKHELGFVPGNLAWATRRQQSSEQAFKILAQLRFRVSELESEITRLTQGEMPS